MLPDWQELQEAFYVTTGEQAEWGFGIPSIFRILASPSSGQSMPKAPRPGDPLEYSCGYWSSLLHMLLYSLGWARPDRGLWWWYQNGKPVDDLRLELLAEVFDRDGQLDWFAAWLWNSPYWLVEHSREIPSSFHELTGWSDSGALPSVDREWIDARLQDADSSGIHNPFSGGSDPLHLSVHCAGPLNDVGQPSLPLLNAGKNRRRAVLTLTSMQGWYATLCNEANSLPPLAEGSWHVDVFVMPTGWLGTFRRSRTTGLWYSGRHRFHVPGA
jgi:hypothetical protein